MREFDIVIVGGGPAGLTAAIYAARAGKKVVVIEKQVCGGQITYSPEVENYPGFINISGNELAENLVEQAMNLGADIDFDEVQSISNGEYKTVITGSEEYRCKAVVIATGARCRILGVPGEKKLTGSGVSYCAVCDGAFFRNKIVAVNGGGNTALTDAIYLAGICDKVYLIHRRDSFRAEPAVIDKLSKYKNIVLVMNSVITEINGQGTVEGIKVQNVNSKDIKTIELNGVFIAVGRTPETEQFASVIELDNGGYAVSKEDCLTRTNGIFVAGDCRNREVKQLTTAVADGAVAALAAVDYLR